MVFAGAVDDDIFTRLRWGGLSIRQTPGPHNSLGLIKFMFPNEYDVYLHSTPAQELFSRSRRDFSHGCIRVEDPARLAAWVLRGNPGWNENRIHEAMHGSETVNVSLQDPVLVVVFYATAEVLETCEVRFFPDIYGHDATMQRALATGYPRPGQ
jgi:murein L,D-transpeptidase YcbB/YkuD